MTRREYSMGGRGIRPGKWRGGLFSVGSGCAALRDRRFAWGRLLCGRYLTARRRDRPRLGLGPDSTFSGSAGPFRTLPNGSLEYGLVADTGFFGDLPRLFEVGDRDTD